MKLNYFSAILFILLLNCSDKKKLMTDGIGSSLVSIKTTVNKDEFTSISYSYEATEILERHRTKLKSILPQMLDGEVNLYKNTLTKLEQVPALTYNLDESEKLISKIKTDAAISLVQHEIELNKIYFELFNELTILNLKYDHTRQGELKDYYDAGPIVLSDEVMLKIDELVKDEDQRNDAEEKKNNQDMAFAIFTIIPGTGSCRGILEGVTQAAKYYKRGAALNANATKLSKLSFHVMNKNVSNYISKTFRNNKIRGKVSQIGYVGIVAGSVKKGSTYLTAEDTRLVYKVLENKIKGRIGDFSDGILSVHMQRVRDIIKYNTQQIKVSEIL